MIGRVILLLAGCLSLVGCERRARVVKAFATTPPAIVWQAWAPSSCGSWHSIERPREALHWVECRRTEPRATCHLVTFEHGAAPTDCSHTATRSFPLEGGRWSAIPFEGGTRFSEERSSSSLLIDVDGAGARTLVVSVIDAGVPRSPFDDLVVATFWFQDANEQSSFFHQLPAAQRMAVLKTGTPSYESIFDELFESLTAEEQTALTEWQLEQALPSDGGLPASSILLYLLDHPGRWPPDFRARVTRAYEEGVARPVLVTHAAWWGVREAQVELCRELGRALHSHTQAEADPFSLAVIAERKLQCEWVPEVMRRELPRWAACEECSLERSHARAREVIERRLTTPAPERTILDAFMERRWEPTPALAALAVQQHVPVDVAIKVARLGARLVGPADCVDWKTRSTLVGLPPEIRRFEDDWGCTFTFDDRRRVVSVSKSLK